jgi:hypothetical protein
MATPSFKVVASIQAAVLFAAFFAWWAANASAYLATPQDGDLYAHHWGFQAMVGAVYLLGFSVAVATLLILERCILLMFRQRASKMRGSANEP